MPNPTCSVPECTKNKYARGMCSMHYTRMKRHGTVSDDCLVRQPNVGACTVEGCDSPSRKRGWCASHYAQWVRSGEVKPFAYKWSERGTCIVCGADCSERGRRQYCSSRCQGLASRHGKAPDMVSTCTRCGIAVDVSINSETNRKKRSDTLVCDRCRRRKQHRHRVSINELFMRDGNACSICSEEIDMELNHPHLQSPSVDHVIPYSQGGAHSIENLALAHLHCNLVKSNRIGWLIAPTT